jgi:hypothetical protein
MRPTWRLVLVPALLTLAVTLLRLAGELMGGPSTLFSRAVGGGAAVVGIVWLVPVFGVFFARRIARDEPAPVGRAAAFAVAGLAAFAALIAFAFSRPTASPSQFAAVIAGAGVGLAIARPGWPRLWTALAAYGLAARVPVAIVILAAVLGGWNTHYDVPPPGLPPLSPLARWVAIGLIPQLTIWMALTVLVGTLCGSAAVALWRPRTASS